jgi:hypothetical protein
VIAHVGVVPLEELAPALAGGGSWLMLHLRRGARDSRELNCEEPTLMRIASRLGCRSRLMAGVCVPGGLAAETDEIRAYGARWR